MNPLSEEIEIINNLPLKLYYVSGDVRKYFIYGGNIIEIHGYDGNILSWSDMSWSKMFMEIRNIFYIDMDYAYYTNKK